MNRRSREKRGGAPPPGQPIQHTFDPEATRLEMLEWADADLVAFVAHSAESMALHVRTPWGANEPAKALVMRYINRRLGVAVGVQIVRAAEEEMVGIRPPQSIDPSLLGGFGGKPPGSGQT